MTGRPRTHQSRYGEQRIPNQQEVHGLYVDSNVCNLSNMKAELLPGRIFLTTENREEVPQLLEFLRTTDLRISAKPDIAPPWQEAIPDLLHEVFSRVRPRSDMEAATVFAYVGCQTGEPGVNRALARAYADAVGWRQPSDWQHTFANAGRSRLIRSVGHGWKAPTADGERFVTSALEKEEPSS